MIDDYPEVTDGEWYPGWCLCGDPWGEDERCIWGSDCAAQREADKFKAEQEKKVASN